MPKKISLYFYTILNLKFIQIFYQVFYRIKAIFPVSRRVGTGQFIIPSSGLVDVCQKESYTADDVIYCINESCEFKLLTGVDNSRSKLFLYNVHYFDFLINKKSDQKKLTCLIDFWIENCDFYTNLAGHAYPTSLRIVNWIKWRLLTGNSVHNMDVSISNQAVFLLNNLEYNILGNHLFTNAKALIFYGVVFEGDLPQRCLKKGIKIFKKEVEEQVLADGANFELSPMYHGIMLEDILDLVNLSNAYSTKYIQDDFTLILNSTVEKMLKWLVGLTPQNGEYLHFNDSTQGVAPPALALSQYAERLGFSLPAIAASDFYTDSGYARLSCGNFAVFCNASEMGPKYIPGHAHADTLSFEVWYRGLKLLGNLGTSVYGLSERRLFERGTSSHSTVVINNTNSSQVWSGFRVAKRANVISSSFSLEPLSFEASHNGYQKQGQGVIHNRRWSLNERGIEINDSFLTDNSGNFSIFYHFHPDVRLIDNGDGSIDCHLNDQRLVFNASHGRVSIIESDYSCGFSVTRASQSIVVNDEYQGDINIKCGLKVIK